ncbi:MAG TPA: copper resistance protein CopC [Rhizobiales bacterium]|nr:copper resistance protein CopC [Hyphomicrobiales bacterium]
MTGDPVAPPIPACRTARRRLAAVRPLAFLAVAVLSWLVAAPGHALAHAAFISSRPADGAVVAAAPSEMLLTFSEPVSPLVLRLILPDGSATDLTVFDTRDAAVSISLPDLPHGTSVLSWRVVSTDGHPVGGSVSFSVGRPSADRSAGAVADTMPAFVRAAIWAARTVLYLGLFLGTGGAFFLAVMAPDSSGGVHWIRAFHFAGLAAAPLALGLQGVDALGVELAGLFDGRTWSVAAGTSYALTVVVAVVALAAGTLATGMGEAPARRLAGVAALLCTGLALALSGHASAAAPQWLTRPAVFLHAVSAAFWLGALVPLAALMRAPDHAALAALARFSRAIAALLAALAAAGIVLAVIQVIEPQALGGTRYGQVLLAKLGLVVVLLALAALNRWRFTAPALAGDAAAARGLRRSVRAELVVVAAILSVVALWRFTPPPRALIAEAATPVSVHLHTARAMADLSVTPGRAGRVAVAIYPMDADFSPMEAKEVTLVLAKADAGIEPLRRAAVKVDGAWRIDEMQVPLAGVWQVRVDILISDFEIEKMSGEMILKP